MENKDFNTEDKNTVPASSEDISIELTGVEEEAKENKFNFFKKKKDNQEEKKEFNLMREIREWVVAIVVALAVVFVLKTFLFDIVKVDGHSMDPTLAHGQHLILRRIGYTPERGDIVVLDSRYKAREALANTLDSDFDKFLLRHEYFTQSKHGMRPVAYIKRVIGLPGDTIVIADGKVYVNGEELKEDYIQGSTTSLVSAGTFTYTVEEGHVFVMGDNREHSSDSRHPLVGSIPYEAVWGEVCLRIWPLNQIGTAN